MLSAPLRCPEESLLVAESSIRESWCFNFVARTMKAITGFGNLPKDMISGFQTWTFIGFWVEFKANTLARSDWAGAGSMFLPGICYSPGVKYLVSSVVPSTWFCEIPIGNPHQHTKNLGVADSVNTWMFSRNPKIWSSPYPTN